MTLYLAFIAPPFQNHPNTGKLPMGKLELSHFSERPEKKTSRRGVPKRDEASAERFGSLVEGNPFKIAGEEVRRNRRRNLRGRDNTKSNSGSPILQSRTEIDRSRGVTTNHIVSKRVRNTLPELNINEESVFPELSVNVDTRDIPIAAKYDHTPAAQNSWSKSGKDIITNAVPSKAKPSTDITVLGPIKPGWVRLSKNGCEYGPRSEHYERLLELQQQTNHIIHREFFARNSRIMNDGYNDDRYDGGFFSDDDTMCDCDDNDYDAKNSDDDDGSDDEY
jgi:hypothetical protein